MEISVKGKLLKMCSTLEVKILKEFYIVRGLRRVINSTEEFSRRVTVRYDPDGRKFRRFRNRE